MLHYRTTLSHDVLLSCTGNNFPVLYMKIRLQALEHARMDDSDTRRQQHVSNVRPACACWFLISCSTAASGEVLLWVMEQVSPAFYLSSFWPVLTEAKAVFDNPAASQQAWEGAPPQDYPACFQKAAKHFTFGVGSMSKFFSLPFQTCCFTDK